MAIKYRAESKKYEPGHIQTLLVGEAPPANGKTYFYVPKPMNPEVSSERQANLPGTVFGHYFRSIPAREEEYANLLTRLKKRGVFLIDICDEPIKVRNSPEGVARIIAEIPKLRSKLKRRKIRISEDKIIFLHARRDYTRELRSAFPNSKHTCWMCFRMNWE